MLPPFKIRNLRHSSSSPSPARSSSAHSREPIVRISAPEYDQTVSRHPDATLKYIDEDDCDVITVGTSLELAQRLEEPLPLPVQNGIHQTHHIFDIDREGTSKEIWKAYEQLEPGDEHKLRRLNQKWWSDELPYSNDQHQAVRDIHGEAVAVDTSRQQKSDTDDSRFVEYRERWFQACNPPLVQVHDQKHEDPVQENDHSAEDFSRRTNLAAAPPASCYLTKEGKRQAQAAGDRIRAIASSSCYPRKHYPCADAPISNNRWASYSRSASPFVDDHARALTSESDSVQRAGKRQPQVAEDTPRKSRVRHCKSFPSLSDHGVDKPHYDNSGVRRMAGFEDANTSLVNSTSTSGIDFQVQDASPKSLLQLFESELALAKDSQGDISLCTKERRATSAFCPDSVTSNLSALSNPPRHSERLPSAASDRARNRWALAGQPLAEEPLFQSMHQAVDDIRRIIYELEDQVKRSNRDQSRQQINQAFRLGLSTALHGFSVCLTDISDSVEKALASTECSAPALQQPFKAPRNPTGEISCATDTDARKPKDFKSRYNSRACAVTNEDLSQLRGHLNSKPAPDPEQSRAHPFESTLDDLSTSELTGSSFDWPKRSRTRERLGYGPGGGVAGSLSSLPAQMHSQKQEYTGQNDICSSAHKVSDSPSMDCPKERFPPLPTMEPLVPSRSHIPFAAQKVLGLYAQKSVSNIHSMEAILKSQEMTPSLHAAPCRSQGTNSQPHTAREAESSGEFFNRMTGRSTKDATHDSITCSQNDPSYFRSIDDLRPNATSDELSKKLKSSSRPQSISGSGSSSDRTTWYNTFRPASPRRESQVIEPGNFATEARAIHSQDVSPAQRRSTLGLLTDMDLAVDHSDPATAGKVQECAEQLKTLGFCSLDEDGMRRLIVYAQAADGDLSNAIDMIDEEQQAYQQRR